MDLGLHGKTAFIAASSDGLGKACATELALEGVNVIINGRDEGRLKKAQKEIQNLSQQRVIAIPGDLSIEEVRQSIITQSLDAVEQIDILITNTGGPPSGKFESFSKEDWDKAYEQLLASAVSLIKGFLPGMKRSEWGRIIAITSQAVKQPVEKLILSNSVRASVAGLTKTLAAELGGYNITVNNVLPGYTQTSRLNHLIEKNPSFKGAVNEVPLGRFGDPKEFAAAVTFLASARASYITGVSLPVDGGWIRAIV